MRIHVINRYQIRNLPWLGVILGISLLLISLVVDIIASELSFSWSSIVHLFATNPLHWIILTSPFFLGVVFYVMRAMVMAREVLIAHQSEKEHRQVEALGAFITQLEQGKLDDNIQYADNAKIERLLNSLRMQLITERDEQERRAWISKGMADFGEILRSGNDLKKLSNDLLAALVKYLHANQGAVFLLEDEDPQNVSLKLTACYAFDRKKYVFKNVGIGEGLIGQCYLEGSTTVLTQVPKDFIKITSGLGEASPDFVVVVPIRTDEGVEGVVELASFNKMRPHEIEFVEQVSHAFASVIFSVKNAVRTKTLLTTSQYQTEQLRAQEEELRQNVEEMKAIQEQMTRQLEENTQIRMRSEERERVFGLTTIISETDLYGTITYVNDLFCQVSKYRRDELVGRPHNIVRHPDMHKALFRLFWSTIKRGEIFRGIVKNRAKDGSPYWVDATIVPITDSNGQIVKYIGARYHIKNAALAEELYRIQCEQLKLEDEAVMFVGERQTVA